MDNTVNDPQAEFSRLLQAAREALTDSMVERLSTTAANALEVVDRLNDPGTRAAVMAAIDGLTELHRTGALDTLIQLGAVAHGARNALTDSMVERLSAFAEHMLNNLATEDVADLAQSARGALDQAAEDTRDVRPAGGLFATLALLNRPESQLSLQFLLSFARSMRALSASGGRPAA